ncbi:MAG: zinc ribbon domain-containing protein [Promethearchaeota archaeon]
MGKTKGARVLTVFFVLFLVGGFAWFTLIQKYSKSQSWSGKKYGSPDQPIVLEFQAGSRYDYWEISYTTSGYDPYVYDVRVLKMDRCNYEWYLEGAPYGYGYLPDDQQNTLKLQPSYKSNCADDDIVYIVWDIQRGTVIANIDSYKVYFLTVKGFYGYAISSSALFGLLLAVVLYKSKHPSKFTTKQSKLGKKYYQKYSKRNFCALCGNEIQNKAEYCQYCGKVYTPPNIDESKTKITDA